MLLFIFLVATIVRNSESHGYLKSPRSRNFVANQEGVWSGGSSSTYLKESCPHCLNRGGTLGQCGVNDGRSYDANLSFNGQPMPPAPQARFVQGQEIEVEVVLTAHHLGHFEFFACPISPGGVATAACFQQNPLTFVSDPLYGATKDSNHPTRAYIAPPHIPTKDNSIGLSGLFYRFRFKLPSNVSGDLVLLQWRYYTANSCTYPGYSSYRFPSNWGNMQNGLGLCTNIPPDGNGFPEQFWNCAEISITRTGSGPSPTPGPIRGPSPTSGTCGGGSRGDGFCKDSNLCCSQWGHCGSGSEFCGSRPIGTCGGGSRGNGFCKDSNLCCSKWGHCGTGSAYCGATRQTPTTSTLSSPLATPTTSSDSESLQGCCSWDLGTCDFTSWCSASESNCDQCTGFYIYPSEQTGCLPMWNGCTSTSECCGHAQCLTEISSGWNHCNLPENLGIIGTPTTPETLEPNQEPTKKKPTKKKSNSSFNQ